MLASIVIPAYHPYTLLEYCLTSIINNTDENLVEIIVVCNGSDRESADLVLNNFPNVRLVWYKEALGFTKAANIGFKLVENPITIICNTDIAILDYWPKNQWLYTLIEPFTDPQVGITGINPMFTPYGDFFPFFFTAIRSSLFEKIGYLDIAFSPGYGEDVDFCIRTRLANYKLIDVNQTEADKNANRNVGSFPVYHKGEGSFRDPEKRKTYIQNQQVILEKKYLNYSR